MDLKLIAQQTLDAFERGNYVNADGGVVEVGAAQEECVRGTRLYAPDELAALLALARRGGERAADITVTGETTLQAAQRITASGDHQRVGVLNFASARHPGGGFLSGARAQEESLARSSGLYLSQMRCPAFYSYHRAEPSALYSDHAIYSPACPVIRNDDGEWLPATYRVDVITCAAPNAGAVMRNEPEHGERIVPALEGRAGKILALAAHTGCDALVLGAWGCGVFQNDPAVVARTFHTYVAAGAPFSRNFQRIVFAVYDRSRDQATYRAFAERFNVAG